MPRNSLLLRCSLSVLLAALVLPSVRAQTSAKWKYFRSGNLADSPAIPRPGFALMGGGEQDPALKWLCERANGGDFLILRANTEEDYARKVDDEIRALCPLNSAATIVFSGRDDSDDPQLLAHIHGAQAIYIAGGDQSNYVRFWQDTPVQDALNQHIAAGKPLGGSSAGLAVLGEFSFSSMIDTIHSPEALADPYGNKVTLSRDFLRIPLLAGVITDTHFVKRDRLGRLVVFLARILQDGWAARVRAIAVEESAAVLLEPDGQAKVIGAGPAYFLETHEKPGVCRSKTPLTVRGIRVHRVASGGSFNVKDWKGPAGDDYQLATTNGQLTSIGSSHGLY